MRCRSTLFILCLALSALVVVNVHAQLRVSFLDSFALDAAKFPRYSARVVSTLNGLPFVLTTDNVLVQEDIIVSKPVSVTRESDTVYVVAWTSRSRNVEGGTATVVVFNSVEAASASKNVMAATKPELRTPQVRFTDLRYKRIKELQFGKVPAGNTSTKTIYCLPVSGRMGADGNEQRIRVDSITTGSSYFTAKWRGGLGAWSLPGLMSSPLDYPVSIDFTPPDNQYYQDYLTIYYEGGAIEQVTLIGNTFELPMRTLLNLTKPTGGETFTPCEAVQVAWTGAVKGSTTIIEATYDNGKTWAEIGRTVDTTMTWYVPDIPSDEERLRVRAEQVGLSDYFLGGTNTSPSERVAFNPQSTTLLACYRNSLCTEWDMTTKQSTNQYSLAYSGMANSNLRVYACAYTSDNDFYTVFRDTRTPDAADTIAFFTVGSRTPRTSVAIATNTRYKAAYLDSTRSFVVLTPMSGTAVGVISAKDGTVLRTIPMPAPVTAISMGKNRAAVALLNGSIYLYSLPGWTVERVMSFSTVPLIDQMAILPDNQRIVLGCHASEPTINDGITADVYVVDIATELLVRVQRIASTSPVCVTSNATSRYVLMGYVAQPQGPLWDISPNQVYGSVVGHGGSLIDVAFSPNGFLIASGANAADNLRVREFIYPEVDYTDDVMRVVRPSFAIQQLVMDSTYAYSGRDTTIVVNMCNNSSVPADIAEAFMAQGSHFRVMGPSMPFVINPGECAKFQVRVVPSDTGLLRDEIKAKACALTFTLPVQVYSIPRNLGLPDTIDFGGVCPSTTLDTSFTIATNKDPVFVVIDDAFLSDQTNSWFTPVSTPKNVTLQPGDSARARFRFSPLGVGIQNKVLLVFYGGQRKLFARVVLRGRGVGSEISVRPLVVGFTPEQTSRTVTVRNPNANEIIVTSLGVAPSGAFAVDALSLPRVVAPLDSFTVTVRWLDTNVSEGSLQPVIAPCAAPVNVGLRRYRGSATLRLPKVEADPRGTASLPVFVKIAENFLYGDERTLDAEFTVNPRMFIADSIHANLGRAQIVSQEIDNDLRRIRIRCVADFPYADTAVAVVHGRAGLAETDLSPLRFNSSSSFFGSSVRVNTVDGSLQLTNLCGTRRVVQTGTVRIVGLVPSPADYHATVNVNVSESSPLRFEIFAHTGERVLLDERLASSGLNSIDLPVSQLLPGTYTLTVTSALGSSSTIFMVMR